MKESIGIKVFLVLFFCNTYVLGRSGLSACRKKVESTCSQKGFSTTWNKRNVSKHLKEWIQSISISQEKDDLKDNLRGSKYLQWESAGEEEVVTMIANVECIDSQTPGNPVGKVWKIPKTISNDQFQDGFFYGSLDSPGGTFSGDDVTFIFPDMKTVLVGKFNKDYMVAARESKIIAERCNNGIKEILVAPVDENSPVFKYKRPNAWSMGYNYTLIDPYERKTTYVRMSRYRGQGVFAKRNIKKGELVSYYSGITHKPVNYNTNLTKETHHEIERNVIMLGNGDHINVLKPYWRLAAYRATRGHKHNHSFKYVNSDYGECYHPRYGHIASIYALKNIEKGEEIFINYNFRAKYAPEWYTNCHLKEMGFHLVDEDDEDYGDDGDDTDDGM